LLQAQTSHVARICFICHIYRSILSNIEGHLQHTHCKAPQHAATHCNILHHTLHHTASHRTILQHTATHCNALQHTATHCRYRGTCSITLRMPMIKQPLKHTAAHCSTLQHAATRSNMQQHTATHRNTLQHPATSGVSHSNTLQHTATHRDTLQHLEHNTENAHFRKATLRIHNQIQQRPSLQQFHHQHVAEDRQICQTRRLHILQRKPTK